MASFVTTYHVFQDYHLTNNTVTTTYAESAKKNFFESYKKDQPNESFNKKEEPFVFEMQSKCIELGEIFQKFK